MRKVTTALLTRIVIAVVVVFIALFYVSSTWLDRYYLYEKKRQLSEVTKESDLATLPYTVVRVPLSRNIDDVNDNVRFQLAKQGIPLAKFWLTANTLQSVGEGKTVQQLFNQEKLQVSVIVRLFTVDDELIVVADTLVHLDEPLSLMNQLWFGSMVVASLLLIVLIVRFVRMRLAPLGQIHRWAKDVTTYQFSPLTIETNDEIAQLAETLNWLSQTVKRQHDMTTEEKEALSFFVAQLTHELKTPLATIQAYTIAAEEGIELEDASGIIQQQVTKMDGLISQTMQLIRAGKQALVRQPFSLAALIEERTGEQVAPYTIHGDREWLGIVIDNVWANAGQYGTNRTIELVDDWLIVRNDAAPVDVSQLLLPFVSGVKRTGQSGLGLYIVATILRAHELEPQLSFAAGQFSFRVSLRHIHVTERE